MDFPGGHDEFQFCEEWGRSGDPHGTLVTGLR